MSITLTLTVSYFGQPGLEQVDPTFNPAIGFPGRVLTAVSQPDGKMIIGGVFSNANGTSCTNIARYLADGTLDTTFSLPQFNDSVARLALQPDGKILVAGNFTLVNGVSRAKLARLNSDGTLDLQFDAQASASSSVSAVTFTSDGKILLGGGSLSFHGVNRIGLSKLLVDGSVDTTFTTQLGDFSQSVSCLVVNSDGTIYVGGGFTRIGGISRTDLARIDFDGTVIQSFNANISSGGINEIQALPDGKLIFAGRISIGSSLIEVGRLTDLGEIDPSFSADNRINNWVNGISMYPDGGMLVYGSFQDGSTGVETDVYRLNPDGSINSNFLLSSIRNQTSFTEAFVQPDGKTVLFGEFQRINGSAHFSAVRLNSDNSVDETFGSYIVRKSLTSGFTVGTVVFQPDGKMIVAGDFVEANGKPRRSVARLNANGELDESFNQTDALFDATATSIYINAIALQPDGKVVIAGEFTTVAGVPRRRVARLNSNGTLDLSFDPGFSTDIAVSSVTLQDDGKLLVGGSFTFFNAVPRKNLVRLNSNGSVDMTFDASSAFDTGSGRKSIVQPDGKILVSGVWQSSNNQWRSLVRLNSDGTRDTTFNTLLNDQGPDFELEPNGQIVIGGAFTSVNGVTRQQLALLKADGSLDPAFATGTNGMITSVARDPGGRILIAGSFTQAQGKSRPGLARFSSFGTIDSAFFRNGSDNGTMWKVFIQPDGRIIATGGFTALDGTTRLGIARLIVHQPARFDFDGDGKTDVGITRPNGGIKEWWLSRSSDSNVFSTVFGVDSDISVPADFTGDGKTDIAVFRPLNGNWFILRSEDFTFLAFPFGADGDIPMPADFDGDGKADPAVYRPAASTWFISRTSDGQATIAQFGIPGDQPVAADYDGDGKTDIAVYRQNNGAQEWWIQRSSAGLFATVFGANGDKAVPGDYTGDGKADIAVWRASNGNWLILRSEDFSFLAFPWGANGDLPAPGDYDGDGKTDAAVFRQSSATWFINRTGGSGPLITNFGASVDSPIAGAFIR